MKEDITITKYIDCKEDKKYFTIVNKEMYERLMKNLDLHTNIVWKMENSVINEPFATIFGEDRELIILDSKDGELLYGTLEDFGNYYKKKTPEYCLLTNEDFLSLCKKISPKINSKETSSDYNFRLFQNFILSLDKDMTVRQGLKILSDEIERRLSLEKGDLK